MRFLKIIMMALLVFSSVSFINSNETQAASNISIYLNDSKQSYSNKAMIKNGATLVPLRGIFEGLGANVNWNASTKTIDASKVYSTAQDGTIIATLNCDGYTMNSKEFNVPGEIILPTPEPKPSTGDVNSGTYVVPGAPTSFANCTAMRVVYPSGVKSSHPAYASKHDRDKDGWACE